MVDRSIIVEQVKEKIYKILKSIEDEKRQRKSIWSHAQLEMVANELKLILEYILKEKDLLFRYGKKQRLLESLYILTDSLEPLNKTALGILIVELQELYYLYN